MPVMRSSGGRVTFSASARRGALAHLARRRAEGASVKSVADELGLAYETLRRWQDIGATGFRQVEVVPEVGEVLDASGLVLVAPSGHRVEGLELAQLTELLRALS